MTQETESSTLDRRFDRNRLVIGQSNQQILHDSHVMIVGLGGVGSYTVESLARVGVGRLTLVDHDYVCITNTNRQIPARKGNIGRLKSEVMEELVRSINPRIEVEAIPAFYTPQNGSSFFNSRKPDYVVDAIDTLTSKVHLLKTCLAAGIPVTSTMGAGGKMDPTKVRVMDLWETSGDPLARLVRNKLRKEQMERSFPVVCSDEPPIKPQIEDTCQTKCICPDHGQVNVCESKHVILGSISFVTATFGMMLAGVVVNDLLGTPLYKFKKKKR